VDPFAVPRRHGLKNAARSGGRYLLRGLELLGYATSLTAFVAAEIPPPDGDLPPGHPECLVADLPPSPVERWLWAQLTSGGDA
jgi:hypothetical protein